MAPLDLEPAEQPWRMAKRDAPGRFDEREPGLVLRERLVVTGHASRLDHPARAPGAGGEHVEDRASQVVALTERQEPPRIGGHFVARRSSERRRRTGLVQSERLQRARVGRKPCQLCERAVAHLLRPGLGRAPRGQRVPDGLAVLERQQEIGRLDGREGEIAARRVAGVPKLPRAAAALEDDRAGTEPEHLVRALDRRDGEIEVAVRAELHSRLLQPGAPVLQPDRGSAAHLVR